MANMDLRQHILLPLPYLKDTSRTASLSRDDKLKEIISNIERQQQYVRHKILSSAVSRTTQPQPPADDESTAMDIDTPSEGEISSQDTTAAAMSVLISNLSAPYIEGSGDPCVTSTSYRPVPTPGIRQVTPPPQIQLAKETLEQIDEYNRHASEAKDYYVRALDRRKSSAGFGGIAPSAAAHTVPNPTASASPIDPRRRGR